MNSSPLEIYPVHVSPSLAPIDQGLLIEPSVNRVNAEYLVVQPSREPYGVPQEYTKRVWIC
jgi:hypothetical protein